MKKIMISAALILAILLGSVSFGVYQGKQYRNRPSLILAKSYLRGSWPHQIVGRLIILIPGRQAYNEDVARLASTTSGFAKTFYNQYFLDRLLASLSDEKLSELLPLYPFKPNENVRLLCLRGLAFELGADDWWENHNRAETLDVLQRSPSAEADVRAFVDEKMLRKQNNELFVESFSSIFRRDIVEWKPLVYAYWPLLSQWERSSVIESIANSMDVSKWGYERTQSLSTFINLESEPVLEAKLMLPFLEVMKSDNGYGTKLRKALRHIQQQGFADIGGKEVG